MKKKNEKKVEKKVSSKSSSPSKKSYKLVIFVVIIILAIILCGVGIFFLIKNIPAKEYVFEKEAKEIKDVKCLKKGNVCSTEEIFDGIKIKYAVNDKETYEFYLISNDENTATYIMSDDLSEKNHWSSETINFKGPNDSLYKMNELVSNWRNVPYIESYLYEDYGYQYYLDVCESKEIEEEEYDCNMTAGYQRLEINEGKGLLIHNFPISIIEETPEEERDELILDWDFDGLLLRARSISREEVDSLARNKVGLPSWLIDHTRDGDFYWTISSDTFRWDDYLVSAFTVKNVENKTSMGASYVTNGEVEGEAAPTGYLRPVITLKKQ